MVGPGEHLDGGLYGAHGELEGQGKIGRGLAVAQLVRELGLEAGRDGVLVGVDRALQALDRLDAVEDPLGVDGGAFAEGGGLAAVDGVVGGDGSVQGW